MKVLSKVVATATALALVGSPAFADNKGKGEEMKAKPKKVELTITGTIKSTGTATAPALGTVVVVVKTTSRPSEWKDAATVLKGLLNNPNGVSFTVAQGASIHRGDKDATFASLMIGDKVSMKASCAVVTSTNPNSLGTCTATRINASAATPTPSPSASPSSQLTVVGVLTAIATPGTATITVLTANRSGKDVVYSTGPLLGTSRVFLTASPGTTLTGSPVAGSYVTLKATCTAAPALAPSVTSPCTATSIAVIVPTA